MTFKCNMKGIGYIKKQYGGIWMLIRWARKYVSLGKYH